MTTKSPAAEKTLLRLLYFLTHGIPEMRQHYWGVIPLRGLCASGWTNLLQSSQFPLRCVIGYTWDIIPLNREILQICGRCLPTVGFYVDTNSFSDENTFMEILHTLWSAEQIAAGQI